VIVIVIGAGAAGMMCAITAAKGGADVTLIEHGKKAGAKILISGGGRCNFTNMFAGPDRYISDNPHFHKSALARYTPHDFLELLTAHDITWHEKKLGQLFCDQKAPRIVEMLVSECTNAGVKLKLNTSVEGILKNSNGFTLLTSNGSLQSDAVVIATGGKSIPKMGATGFAYQIAEQFEMKVNDTRAGLVPLTFTGEDLEFTAGLSGVSQDAMVICNGVSFRENILFTHRGISGPAILQISSYFKEGDGVTVKLLPDMNLLETLKAARQDRAKTNLNVVLSELIPKRLAAGMIARWFKDKTMANYSNAELLKVAEQVNNWQMKPNGTEGYRTAEVTLGGVATTGLSSKTMESRSTSGLYFIGECVDVTGWLGGYNFQWAWASGFAAGEAISII